MGIAGCWNGWTQTSYWSTFFLCYFQARFCFAIQKVNLIVMSVLTIPVRFDLNFSVEENENNVETSDRELCHLISNQKCFWIWVSLTWHSWGLNHLCSRRRMHTNGVVNQIIDPLVIVSAKKGCPAIDLNSKIMAKHFWGRSSMYLTVRSGNWFVNGESHLFFI